VAAKINGQKSAQILSVLCWMEWAKWKLTGNGKNQNYWKAKNKEWK
jgi:hypothetical protein